MLLIHDDPLISSIKIKMKTVTRQYHAGLRKISHEGMNQKNIVSRPVKIKPAIEVEYFVSLSAPK